MIEKDFFGGEYVILRPQTPAANINLPLEAPDHIYALCASYRYDPFWLRTKYCTSIDTLPYETLFFAVKHKDGSYSAYYSLACAEMRTSFYGKDGCLMLSAISGDETVKPEQFYAYYKISGTDFYTMIANAAKSICDKFQTTALRKDKSIPDFTKYFGWCTWDSFYHAVSKENIEKGLQSFQKGGLIPKFVLIDDGWQSVDGDSGKESYLVTDSLAAFQPGSKFHHSLKDTIQMMKGYGVKKVFVWHAMLGYWSGVHLQADSMQKYKPFATRSIPPIGIKHNNPAMWEAEQRPFGMIDPSMAEAFYDDYHRYLKAEGVDGVKVDSQGTIDNLSQGLGSRTELAKVLHTALEASANRHFHGNLINCMSCSNDVLYHVKSSNMMRSSDDFMPDKPETHIKHIYDNAVSCIWLSEFTGCDWDMFQTTHEYASYHAAARSISGSPIYVSDKVDAHDFDLIAALTNENGEILCSKDAARPVLDCLFEDVCGTKQPFKMFNKNNCSGVVGVFSGEDDATQPAKSISTAPADVDGFSGTRYAAYSLKTKQAQVLSLHQALPVALSAKEFDIITYAEIQDGFAPIGITEKFNSGGAVTRLVKSEAGWIMDVICGGTLLLYSDTPITASTEEAALSVTACADGFYAVALPTPDRVTITCL